MTSFYHFREENYVWGINKTILSSTDNLEFRLSVIYCWQVEQKVKSLMVLTQLSNLERQRSQSVLICIWFISVCLKSNF